MKYVMYGAGAVGGVIGANLQLAGLAVTLVARGEHLRAIREQGLRLDTAESSTRLPVPAVSGADAVPWTDDTVVLLCVKSQQTSTALDDLAAHAPASVPVVSVQNGVANEAAILRRFARTYSICVMLPSGHLEPGVVTQKCHPTPGILDIGRIPRGTDELTSAVAEDLHRAGFESVPRPDIMAWKRRKLVLNLGNAVDAVCVPGDEADELALRAREEAELVLRTTGLPVVSREEDTERRGDILQSRGTQQMGGSTWQSVQRGGGLGRDRLPLGRGGPAWPPARCPRAGQRAPPADRDRARPGRQGAPHPRREPAPGSAALSTAERATRPLEAGLWTTCRPTPGLSPVAASLGFPKEAR